ncbi:MAG: hypothetical protein ACYCOU_19415 [Sulfobacillus sp.]
MPLTVQWTEGRVARELAVNVFRREYLVVVPNCNWPGNECDLLVVTRNLRVIDVEIKISRSDLKADAKKDKWYHYWDWKIDGPYTGDDRLARRRTREWPKRVWKHYYCVPAEIWDDSLMSSLPSPKSGVLLLTDHELNPIRVRRRAHACRTADPIAAADVLNIARLASLRMWDALGKLEAIRA